jgi:hypothetical protein
MTTDPKDPELRRHRADGMQETHLVLSEEERALGLIRPVRIGYTHDECGVLTQMTAGIAETYARDPAFYGSTWCMGCKGYFPVGENGEFTWDGSDEKVGT